MKLGFSTSTIADHVSAATALDLFKTKGIHHVELGFATHRKRFDSEELFDTLSHLDGFAWVSLHAPKHHYGEDQETKEIFKRINHVHAIHPLDLIVFHSDTIKDLSIFKDVTFPFAFENMDREKSNYKYLNSTSKRTAPDF